METQWPRALVAVGLEGRPREGLAPTAPILALITLILALTAPILALAALILALTAPILAPTAQISAPTAPTWAPLALTLARVLAHLSIGTPRWVNRGGTAHGRTSAG